MKTTAQDLHEFFTQEQTEQPIYLNGYLTWA